MNPFVRQVVVAWILLISPFAWLPLVRPVFDEETYLWGMSFFDIPLNGAGLGGDFLYLILKTTEGIQASGPVPVRNPS